jgi:hypothetical protein
MDMTWCHPFHSMLESYTRRPTLRPVFHPFWIPQQSPSTLSYLRTGEQRCI